MAMVGPCHPLAAQQVAAHRVAQRQRIAARSVAGAEPALEVDAPHRVGLVGRGERLAVGWAAWTAPPLARQPALGQPAADRARRRRHDLRPNLSQLAPKLLRTPAVALVQCQDRAHQLALARTAVMVRCPAAVLQPVNPFQLVALQPLVASVAADPEGAAHPRHHRPFFRRRKHKAHPLLHGTGLFPRHRQTLLPSIENLSAMYPVHSVSNLSGPYPHPSSPPSGGEEKERTAKRMLPHTNNSPAMNLRASSVRGASKNAGAGAVSTRRPRCSSTTSPARRRASPRSWVDITTLMPRWLTVRIRSSIALVEAGSRLAVGSSRDSTSGSHARARARAPPCCSPAPTPAPPP